MLSITSLIFTWYVAISIMISFVGLINFSWGLFYLDPKKALDRESMKIYFLVTFLSPSWPAVLAAVLIKRLCVWTKVFYDYD